MGGEVGMIEINIQMPEKCGMCPCFHPENPMYCKAVKADKNKKIVAPYGAPRPEWCPLKEQEAVVRCKDCKYGEPGACGYGVDCDGVWHDADWFCADGEREENAR